MCIAYPVLSTKYWLCISLLPVATCGFIKCYFGMCVNIWVELRCFKWEMDLFFVCSLWNIVMINTIQTGHTPFHIRGTYIAQKYQEFFFTILSSLVLIRINSSFVICHQHRAQDFLNQMSAALSSAIDKSPIYAIITNLIRNSFFLLLKDNLTNDKYCSNF